MRRIMSALIFMLILLLFPSVNAATCSFNAPTANENITTSPYTLNINCLPSNGDGAIYNVTFRYSSDGSTYTTIATVQNTTDNQTTFTYSWDWSSVADGTYYINATGYEYNVSSGALLSTGSAQVSGVGLDDTPPTISKITYTNTVDSDAAQTITIKASDTGFSDGVQTCRINLLLENRIVTASDKGVDLFKYTFTPSIAGINTFKVTCTDYHGWSTTTKKYQFYVSAGGYVSGGGSVVAVTPEATSGTTGTFAYMLFILSGAGLLAIIYIIVYRGRIGGRRRRRRKR